MAARPGERRHSVRNGPVEARSELARGDVQSIEAQRDARAEADTAPQADRLAEQVGERRIGHRGDARVEVRAHLPGAGRDGRSDPCRAAGSPDVVERDLAGAHIARNPEQSARKIALQGDIRARRREAQSEIFGGQALAIEKSCPTHDALDEARIEQVVARRDACQPGIEREGPAHPIVTGRTLLAQIRDPRCAAAQFSDFERVIHGKIAQRAVECRGEGRIFEPETSEEARIAQIRRHDQIAHTVLGQVDQPLGPCREGGCGDDIVAIDPAFLDRRLRAQRDGPAQHISQKTVERRSRFRLPQQTEAPGAIGDPERREAVLAPAHQQRSVPPAPAAIACDASSIGRLRADDSRDRAAFGRHVI